MGVMVCGWLRLVCVCVLPLRADAQCKGKKKATSASRAERRFFFSTRVAHLRPSARLSPTHTPAMLLLHTASRRASRQVAASTTRTYARGAAADAPGDDRQAAGRQGLLVKVRECWREK